ncbi:putative membrane protein [Synechococcus sp. A18-46.1]|nr:putative membrane protein [Synechococcus sp. A18-46.1]
MSFFRTTLLAALIVVLFALALVAVSARIWLPGDMLAPAPIG